MCMKKRPCWLLPSSDANRTMCTSWDFKLFKRLSICHLVCALTSLVSFYFSDCMPLYFRLFSHAFLITPDFSPFPFFVGSMATHSSDLVKSFPCFSNWMSSLSSTIIWSLLHFFHGTYRYVTMYLCVIILFWFTCVCHSISSRRRRHIYFAHFCILRS